MPNDGSTLQYRTSILNKLITLFPRTNQEQIDIIYDKLDQSTEQQLNRYWALIQGRDLDTLKKEFYEPSN